MQTGNVIFLGLGIAGAPHTHLAAPLIALVCFVAAGAVAATLARRAVGLHAEIAMPGSDWMAESTDRFSRPDVRVALTSEDGALILMHYTGLVEATPAFVAAANEDRATDWDDQYMRFAVAFDTGAERYRWLNQSLFVARGHILGTHELQYEIYRVT